MDITYVPMARGFVYLGGRRRLVQPSGSGLAAVDHHGGGFCIEALEEALARHGRPEIFNTDQGSQFTSQAFTGVLNEAGIAISMDGKGAWRDNVFVERLWRSIKYEEVYLQRLRHGQRGPRLDRPVPDLLQWAQAPFEP